LKKVEQQYFAKLRPKKTALPMLTRQTSNCSFRNKPNIIYCHHFYCHAR